MIDTLKDWAGFIALVISIAGSIYAFMTSGSKTNSGKISGMERKLIEHDRRIQTVEDEIKHLPDIDTAHELQLGMTRLAGQLDAQYGKLSGRLDTLNEKLKPIEGIADRLQEFLLERAK